MRHRREALAALTGAPIGPPPKLVATFEDWKHAVAIAHARLCQGSDGCAVGAETWVQAIARIAGGLLYEHDYGAPKGGAPDEWVNFLKDVARRPSTSKDGMIAREGGMRIPLKAWPLGVELAS